MTTDPALIGDPVVTVTAAVKTFRTGTKEFSALRGIDLSARPGEFVAIVGRSGSGKSTLLNLIAGIDRPTSGRIEVAGTELGDLGENRLAAWRGKTVGVVFQFFPLLPTLTVAENVILPMELCRTVPARHRRARARALDLLDLIAGLAAAGTCVLMVTHERDITSWVRRTVTLADGKVSSPPAVGAAPSEQAVPC